MDFKGKKILFFYPYGATKHYGDSIKEELLKRGARVKSYDERPSQNSLVKIAIRLLKKKVPFIFSFYVKRVINQNKDIEFDHVLVCRGEAFTKSSVDLLRAKYTNAVFTLYLWDILRTTNMEDVIPYFDKVLSFDPDDSDKYGLIFRPTFFVPAYREVSKRNIVNDIVFIGTLHSNRYFILDNLRIYLNQNKISHFFYLYMPSFFVLLKKKFIEKKPVDIRNIHLKAISLNETLKVVEKSKCILDINFTGQKSLSTRPFEAMASKTKYITTNSEIKKYDFYNPQNILLIDLDNLSIPQDFINTEFVPIPDEILNRYSVEQLVTDLFN